MRANAALPGAPDSSARIVRLSWTLSEHVVATVLRSRMQLMVKADAEALAVVLVHGWAGNRRYWDNQVDHIAERNLVVAVDLGGHGESALGRADWNLVAFGDDVRPVVDEVGARKVALVGHSMGGDAIVHAARKLGDRLGGLVWVDAFRSLGNEPESTPAQAEGFLAPFRADFGAAVAQFVRGMFPATADPELVDRIATDMTTTPLEVAMSSLARRARLGAVSS